MKNKTFSIAVLSGLLFLLLLPGCSNSSASGGGGYNYTVTFDSQGAETIASPSTMNVASPATTLSNMPSIPVKAGFSFQGWYTETEGNGNVFSESTAVSGNITVFAFWQEASTYTVIFDSQGAETPASPASMTVTSPSNTLLTLPTAPEKSGYTFQGWYTEENGGGEIFTTSTEVSSDMTLYAYWTVEDNSRVYIQSYIDNGALAGNFETSGQVDTYYIRLDTAASLTIYTTGTTDTIGRIYSPNSTLLQENDDDGSDSNFSLNSVMLQADGDYKLEVSAYSGGTGEYQLYLEAETVAAFYTISFDSNGGSEVDSVTVEEGTVLNFPIFHENPTRENYAFDGWFYEDVTTLTVSADLTLTARWTPCITLSGYFGDGPESDYALRYDGTEPFNYDDEYPWARTGYIFNGWCYDQAGTQRVEEALLSAPLTLYPDWISDERGSATLNELDYYKNYDIHSQQYTVRIDGVSAAYVDTTTELVIPETLEGMTVTTIGANAFYENYTLEKVAVPASVSYLASSSFAKNHIKEIHFLGTEAPEFRHNDSYSDTFYNILYDLIIFCPPAADYSSFGFTGYMLHGSKDYLSLSDGTLVYRIDEGHAAVTGYIGTQPPASLVIPENFAGLTVEVVAEHTFDNCINITDLSLPSGLKVIDYAFQFIGISSLSIPAGIESMDAAFRYCSALETVEIAEGVNSMDSAFYDCNALDTVNIPASVQSMTSAFNSCDSLINGVTLAANMTHLPQMAFDGCYNLEEIALPAGLETIGAAAFRYCALSSITLPTNVTVLENQVFSGNELSSIDLSNITSIGAHALAGCPLGTVNLPAAVTVIEEGTFQNCELTSINLDNVTSIGESAFEGNNFTTLSLPDLAAIAPYTFKDCNLLQSITIPATVQTIGRGAFESCTALSSINIPQGISIIDERVFYECDSLASITLPDSVQTIGVNAFWYAGTSSFTFEGDAPDVPVNESYGYISTFNGISGATLNYPATATGFDVEPWRVEDGHFTTIVTY